MVGSGVLWYKKGFVFSGDVGLLLAGYELSRVGDETRMGFHVLLAVVELEVVVPLVVLVMRR